jgi:uncharacterized protein (DUF433 family)
MDVLEQLQSLNIVHSDPEIMSGMLVFTGTRVPLKTFFDYLEGEEGLTEFLADFPHLQTSVLRVLEVMAKVMLMREPGIGVYSAG